jgi:fused signal recognition particle receptor
VPAVSKVVVTQVLLAAGDTFRAAAAEQLEQWAERSGAGFHAATSEKQRPDSVLYQAVQKATKVLS